jgi:hypothetical protein
MQEATVTEVTGIFTFMITEEAKQKATTHKEDQQHFV